MNNNFSVHYQNHVNDINECKKPSGCFIQSAVTIDLVHLIFQHSTICMIFGVRFDIYR
jgi:hypothetical protein